MGQKKLIRRRRFGVVTTLVSLFGAAFIFEYAISHHQWSMQLSIIEFVMLGAFFVSFIFTFLKTGLWKFTHKPLAVLDEREMELTSKSLRYAYGLFSVIVLIILLVFSLLDRPLSILLVVALILFAHLLPASIMAWTEKPFIKESTSV